MLSLRIEFTRRDYRSCFSSPIFESSLGVIFIRVEFAGHVYG